MQLSDKELDVRERWKAMVVHKLTNELNELSSKNKNNWLDEPFLSLENMRVEIMHLDRPLTKREWHFIDTSVLNIEEAYKSRNLEERLTFLTPVRNALHFLKIFNTASSD